MSLLASRLSSSAFRGERVDLSEISVKATNVRSSSVPVACVETSALQVRRRLCGRQLAVNPRDSEPVAVAAVVRAAEDQSEQRLAGYRVGRAVVGIVFLIVFFAVVVSAAFSLEETEGVCVDRARVGLVGSVARSDRFGVLGVDGGERELQRVEQPFLPDLMQEVRRRGTAARHRRGWRGHPLTG